MPEPGFGCADCWPEGADEAWQARGRQQQRVDLVDESHFHLMLMACGACGQRFLSVFTEVVDWADGDDSQYWQHLPVTAAEADTLRAAPEADVGGTAEGIGQGRRSLRHDHPKGASAAKNYWSTGVNCYH